MLAAMLDAFSAAAKQGRAMSACATEAIDAAGETYLTLLRAGHIKAEGGEGAEPPVTDLLPMLELTSQRTIEAADDPGMPNAPVDAEAMAQVTAIEMMAGGGAQTSRRAALETLAERDRAREAHCEPVRPAELRASDLMAIIQRIAHTVSA